MRSRSSLWLALLVAQTATAFQITPAATAGTQVITTAIKPPRESTTPLYLHTKQASTLRGGGSLGGGLSKPRISKLTSLELAVVINQNNKRAVINNSNNKQHKLLPLVIATAVTCIATLTSPRAARAATPLVVTHGAVVPLEFMPLSLGTPPIIDAGLLSGLPSPNASAMMCLFNSFALMFLVTAMARSVGAGSVYVMRLADRWSRLGNEREKERDMDIEVGLAKEMNWDAYSDLLREKKEAGFKYLMDKLKWASRTDSHFAFNPLPEDEVVFRPIQSEAKDEAMKKADDLYKERQYEQHHHQVHVPRSTLEERAYLEDLSKFSHDKLVEHASARHYLDTLPAGPKKSTWGLYKKQLGNTKQYLSVLPDEVDDLKEELSHAQSLLLIEQAMYQTSNQALKLAMDAQNQELQHARTKDKESTIEELKKFDKKSQEFGRMLKESTTVELPSLEDSEEANWFA